MYSFSEYRQQSDKYFHMPYVFELFGDVSSRLLSKLINVSNNPIYLIYPATIIWSKYLISALTVYPNFLPRYSDFSKLTVSHKLLCSDGLYQQYL